MKASASSILALHFLVCSCWYSLNRGCFGSSIKGRLISFRSKISTSKLPWDCAFSCIHWTTMGPFLLGLTVELIIFSRYMFLLFKYSVLHYCATEQTALWRQTK